MNLTSVTVGSCLAEKEYRQGLIAMESSIVGAYDLDADSCRVSQAMIGAHPDLLQSRPLLWYFSRHAVRSKGESLNEVPLHLELYIFLNF